MKGERHVTKVCLREKVTTKRRLCIDVAALVARQLLIIVKFTQFATVNFHI